MTQLLYVDLAYRLPVTDAMDGSWEPVTDATFDRVVVAIAPRRASLLCVEDED